MKLVCLNVCVIRWNNSLSRMFAVAGGVRQGSTLSPSIINGFMITFLVNLRFLDVGCHVNHQYVGCFLYANDIIVISLCIIGLQQMLVVCSATAAVVRV